MKHNVWQCLLINCILHRSSFGGWWLECVNENMSSMYIVANNNTIIKLPMNSSSLTKVIKTESLTRRIAGKIKIMSTFLYFIINPWHIKQAIHGWELMSTQYWQWIDFYIAIKSLTIVMYSKFVDFYNSYVKVILKIFFYWLITSNNAC